MQDSESRLTKAGFKALVGRSLFAPIWLVSSDLGQDKTLGSLRQVRQMNIQLEDENTVKDTVRVQRPEVLTIRVNYLCAVIP